MADESKNMGVVGWLQTIAIGRKPGRTMVRLAFLIGFALVPYLLFEFVFIPIRVTGPSMYPTYQDHQINFINRLAYLRSEPKRGDIVGIRFSERDVMLLKRIVGLPGEAVHFHHGQFYVNDQPLSEPYLTFPSQDWESPVKSLGPQQYYVVGDNRSMPYDFHEKGAAERNRIVGRILFAGHPHVVEED